MPHIRGVADEVVTCRLRARMKQEPRVGKLASLPTRKAGFILPMDPLIPMTAPLPRPVTTLHDVHCGRSGGGQ